MRKHSQRNLRNGWRGQAMAEYMPTLTTIGTFGIVLLFIFGGVLANTFRDVGDCFQDAAENGQVNAACEGDDNPPEVSDNPDPEGESTEETPPTEEPSEEPSEEPTEEETPPTEEPSEEPSEEPTDDTPPTEDPECTTNCGGGEVGDPEATETPDLDSCTDGDCPDPEETDTPEELACPTDINFDNLAAGTILSDQFAGVTITTNDPVNHPVMIFNSNSPTGGDTDLGTPNQAFGGPGVGDGGAAGKPGENSVALGNVMIISQDGNTNNPNDSRDGGNITFTFDNATEVSYIYFLDVDDQGDAATVTLYDQGGSELTSGRVEVPEEGGHNGVFRVDLNQTGVFRMSIDQPGSGAIASLFFCEEPLPDTPDGTEEPPTVDPPYGLECSDVIPIVIEPRENNAQHVMVQYPIECDEDGNYIEPGAGVSTLRVESNPNAYFSAHLSGHLTANAFDAWCVDYDNPISTGRDYTGDNYDSPTVSVDRPENLPLIAWLINEDLQSQGYSVADIQGAIWLLMDTTPINRTDLGRNSESLVLMAEQNAGDANTDPTMNINENGPSYNSETISVSETANGEIESGANNRVHYELTLADGETVDISLTEDNGSGIDTYLRILDSNGNLIAQNDDVNYPSNTNSAVSDFSINGGGTVIIEVGTYADRGNGDYELSVTAVAQAPSFAVTGLTLINSNNNSSMGSINDGQTIDLSDGRSIRADVSGNIGSVVFSINGGNIQTESNAPYAIDGDSNGNYNAWDYAEGTYTLTATPYSNSGGNGNAGQAYSIQITIEEAAPEASTVYVENISNIAYWDGNRWIAESTISLLNDLGDPVEGVTVRVDYTRGGGNNKTCTTGVDGTCTTTSNRIRSNRNNTVVSIDTLLNTGSLTYDSNSNNDNQDTINRPN